MHLNVLSRAATTTPTIAGFQQSNDLRHRRAKRDFSPILVLLPSTRPVVDESAPRVGGRNLPGRFPLVG